jgi:phosphatidylethanolamine-binding protein (PEBP) family uncharacterized protein
VAQRTGPERLLGPAAKATSARFALALVVGALALGGCGGGSEQESPATTSASSAAEAKGAGAGAPAPNDESKASGQKQGSGASQQGGEGKGAKGATAQGQGKGQKRGPRIAAPSGPAEQAPTPEQIEAATVADISLQSPAIVAAAGRLGRLAPTHTCDGKDSWPAFTWSGVPPGTAELILFAMNLQPVNEAIFFDWAVAGIDPAASGIEAAKLPPGAVVGTNSFGEVGYSLCPPGAGETYMFALYALPRELGLRRGFDPKAARKAVLDLSGNAGLLPAVYERG